MKVLLLMIVCIQDPFLELSKSCITVPMKEQFDSVPECTYFVEEFRLRNFNKSLYIDGFCTTKTFT